jgi:predicted Zn-dependent protease
MQLRFTTFLILLGGTFNGGCATSPEGRSQLMVMPDGTVNQQGAESFEQLKKTTPIDRNPKTNAYVKCIANAIVDSNKDRISQDNWEVVVFDSKQINDFALPGAKIGVFSGILPVAHTPAELAAVIGHEVGHVIARHGNERMSTALLTQGLVAGAGLAASNSHYQSVMMAALGAGAQFGVLLPFSRKQESEADLIGLELMAKAGFNPQEAVELWQNMSKAFNRQEPAELM